MNNNTNTNNNNNKITELEVEILNRSNNIPKDCLACKLTGTTGLLFMSIYLFAISRKQTNLKHKYFTNIIGSGIHLE